MKKLPITLSIIALLVTGVFIGCKKDAVTAPQTPVEKPHTSSLSRVNLTTPGEKHNYILGEYHTQYGFTAGNLTVAQVRAIILHSAEIAIAADIIDNTINPSDFADAMIQKKIDLGMFTSNGIYRTAAENLTIMEGEITNTAIKTAIHNINNYNGSHSGFIAYAQAQVSGLQNLSAGEQEMMTGYMSVLSNSFSYWDNYYQGLPAPTPGSNERRTRDVTMVDAMGFTNGLYGENGTMDFRRAILFSEAMSGSFWN